MITSTAPDSACRAAANTMLIAVEPWVMKNCRVFTGSTPSWSPIRASHWSMACWIRVSCSPKSRP